ncbi:MAG: tRNA 4-thiouridine(8) synthase ThiI [Clostridiales bacterium]|jgi:thiamine biosynthesis protein ThiI|nr:tRNA 4-thiouridine(8) synthase ThiI [Clostridiales bacterium]
MNGIFKAFLVKYGEIGIKGKNRYIFENALMDQIRYALKPFGDFYVLKEQGRIIVEAHDEFDYDDVIGALTKVFGIVAICPVAVVENNEWENLKNEATAYMKMIYEEKELTFKVAARRSDKAYPLDSMEICAKMGEHILDTCPNLNVDVHNPEVKLNVEIRNKTYLFSLVIPGPGGMPVGSNGKAMLLLSGGIDSPVAGYMIAKRGVALEAVYFHSHPYTSDRAKQKVVDLAGIVARYSGPIKLHVVPFTEIQLYIHEKTPHEQLTIIMRRIMMQIAEKIADKQGALGLITGESIGQVASQTIQSLNCTNAVCSMPVFRPVIGFDKQEIVNISQRIGTYETSILPFEDCCTIFVAKHPVTKPNLKAIMRSEEMLIEMNAMIERAINETEVILAQR